MSALLVSFVLATYQRGPVVVDCLRKVEACGLKAGGFEIIVVDNASPDGTGDLVARELPGVKLIRLARNEGPVAKNHGIKAARGEFVVFLDDDAFPLGDAVGRMVEHFKEDAQLGAAVFDVMLPDGARECSAYPEVFIGAGTGFRREVLEKVGGLPAEFFMQAEEYDLSFRILAAGYSIKHFADMPLRHLKAANARIAHRTTQLDVRNNLYLLSRYVPAPLCHELAADWLARYWMMAQNRDRTPEKGRPGETVHPRAHRDAFVRGAAEGMARWSARRSKTRRLSPAVIEQIFKFGVIQARLAEAKERLGFTRLLFADFGKNMLAYYRAAQALAIPVVAIADNNLAGPGREYRDIPILQWEEVRQLSYDGILVSNLSPVHARKRAATLRQSDSVPVIDLFARSGEKYDAKWPSPAVSS